MNKRFNAAILYYRKNGINIRRKIYRNRNHNDIFIKPVLEDIRTFYDNGQGFEADRESANAILPPIEKRNDVEI
jgi:hypothetical protein